MDNSFKTFLGGFAGDQGWTITDLSEKSVVLDVPAPSGTSMEVYVYSEGEKLVFRVPSAAVFDEREDIIDQVSTYLLGVNAVLETGFWALEELEDGWGYVLHHDQAIHGGIPGGGVEEEVIRCLIEAMVKECEEFNEIWEKWDW